MNTGSPVPPPVQLGFRPFGRNIVKSLARRRAREAVSVVLAGRDGGMNWLTGIEVAPACCTTPSWFRTNPVTE